MDKLLSQEEIDALLKGMESGEVDTTPQVIDRSEIMAYDFANQDRIIRGRMPTLEMIGEQFSRFFRNTLSSALRRQVDVMFKGIQMKKFGEFIKTIPVPSSLHIFKMEPLRGYAILAIEAKLVFTLLDVFLGGSGKTDFRIEGRDFTAIENRLIQKVVNMIFIDMQKAWKIIQSIHFIHIRSEINPQFVSIVPSGDIIIHIGFNIELDEFTGAIFFCVPYSMIEPIRGRLYSQYQTDQLEVDHYWIRRLINRLEQTEVEVKVELGKANVFIKDLLQWKVGDVFYLDKEVTDSLNVYVQGILKFFGRAGVCGSNKAIQIDERIKIR
jgi:flagellar motor switch protein FliM